MLRGADYPEDGELVVCTVKGVKNYGAFLNLDEYENKEGFIHVRDIATGWVKYIRDYVREGQKVVCKVLSVDPAKGHIDLSLKQVNDHQKRDKIQQWKNEKKAEKLLEIVATKIKKRPEEILDEGLSAMIANYGSLFALLEHAALDEKSFKKEAGKKKWVDAFIEIAKENIQPPKVEIIATMELSTSDSIGIIHIRNALLEGLSSGKSNINIKYMCAPKYRIEVSAADYKIAEEELKKAFENISSKVEEHNGSAKLIRE